MERTTSEDKLPPDKPVQDTTLPISVQHFDYRVIPPDSSLESTLAISSTATLECGVDTHVFLSLRASSGLPIEGPREHPSGSLPTIASCDANSRQNSSRLEPHSSQLPIRFSAKKPPVLRQEEQLRDNLQLSNEPLEQPEFEAEDPDVTLGEPVYLRPLQCEAVLEYFEPNSLDGILPSRTLQCNQDDAGDVSSRGPTEDLNVDVSFTTSSSYNGESYCYCPEYPSLSFVSTLSESESHEPFLLYASNSSLFAWNGCLETSRFQVDVMRSVSCDLCVPWFDSSCDASDRSWIRDSKLCCHEALCECLLLEACQRQMADCSEDCLSRKTECFVVSENLEEICERSCLGSKLFKSHLSHVLHCFFSLSLVVLVFFVYFLEFFELSFSMTRVEIVIWVPTFDGTDASRGNWPAVCPVPATDEFWSSASCKYKEPPADMLARRLGVAVNRDLRGIALHSLILKISFKAAEDSCSFLLMPSPNSNSTWYACSPDEKLERMLKKVSPAYSVYLEAEQLLFEKSEAECGRCLSFRKILAMLRRLLFVQEHHGEVGAAECQVGDYVAIKAGSVNPMLWASGLIVSQHETTSGRRILRVETAKGSRLHSSSEFLIVPREGDVRSATSGCD